MKNSSLSSLPDSSRKVFSFGTYETEFELADTIDDDDAMEEVLLGKKFNRNWKHGLHFLGWKH